MASTRLTFTQGTPTDGTVWTYSGWIKIADGTDTNTYALITSYQGTNNDRILIDSSRRIHVEFKDGASTVYEQHTTAKLRDINGWYHVVVAFDSSEAQADRVKIYLNGTRLTDMDIDQELTTSGYTTKGFNASTKVMDVGTYNAAGSYTSFFDGSMAHVHFTDGTAYTASAFGETDATTGQWKPKTSPSVTYGNNGWFLKFANSGSMGTDSSGNGNNFTVAAGTLTQTQDTPSNVFATLNSLNRRLTNNVPTYSNGNTTLQGQTVDGQNNNAIATIGDLKSGKYYFEVKVGTAGDTWGIGISDNPQGSNGNGTGGNYHVYYRLDGEKNINNTGSSYGDSFTTGDIISCAFDLDNGTVTFYKNGVSQGTADTTLITNMVDGYTPIGFTNKGLMNWNFGNGYFGTTAVSSANSDDDGYGLFEYAPPTGYYSLCTKNINTYG